MIQEEALGDGKEARTRPHQPHTKRALSQAPPAKDGAAEFTHCFPSMSAGFAPALRIFFARRCSPTASGRPGTSSALSAKTIAGERISLGRGGRAPTGAPGARQAPPSPGWP
jgi:hypothetical protein